MVIVAAVDQSEQAENVLAEAESLSKAFDTPVHVLHVMSRSEFINLGTTKANEGDSINMEEVREVAEDVASDASKNLSIPYETVGRVGKPASQVVEYASEKNARYIVVAGRKRSPTGKVIFGSTLQSILLNANRPVVSTIK